MNAAQKLAPAWTTPDTMFTLVDRANEQGNLSFVVPANSVVALPGNAHRWLLWEFWFDLPLVALKLEADKEDALRMSASS